MKTFKCALEHINKTDDCKLKIKYYRTESSGKFLYNKITSVWTSLQGDFVQRTSINMFKKLAR